MPSTILDTDIKYTHLVDIYNDLKKTNQDKQYKESQSKCQIFESVYEALNWLTDFNDPILNKKIAGENSEQINSGEKVNVLITGSLYLVGLSLKCLNYEIK